APAPLAGREAVPLVVPDERPDRRLPTGIPGVDRVLGGGLVPGSVVLVAGEPGIGKSTLLLQLTANLAAGAGPCLYASGEESRAQVAARARRLGVPPGAATFVSGRELPAVLDAARLAPPAVLVVDSIQAIRDPEQPSLPGGPSQVRACADALVGLAKEQGVAVILAGQVTKEGDIAGPRTLEHAVDVVCSFDGDAATGLRVLAGGKNRFGPEGELAWFEMGSDGLREVDPAGLLASPEAEVGSATALLAAGRRAVALQVQALTSRTGGPPRRHVSGLDPRRFGVIAAVVDRQLSLSLDRYEVYGAAAGGIRVEDPGCDLAVAAAVASAATGRPPPEATAFVGEVGLTGSVRPPPNLAQRLGMALSSGIRIVYCPGDGAPIEGLRVVRVTRLRDALRWCRPSDGRTGRAGQPPTGDGVESEPAA
ncbi:MAG TPA: AAA family ATPase, partial [Actinomycetota bacterium]|nr:AAA family ATPase [Actinomycetota bacterium]